MSTGSGEVAIDVKHQPLPETPERKPGEFCGHQWHWAEVVFFILVLLGVITAVVAFANKNAASKIPPLPFAIILLITAVMALSMIWNLATTKKLAETAEQLEKTISQEKQALADAEVQKRNLERNTAEVRAKLESLQQSVQLLGGSVQNVAVVEAKLSEIYKDSAASQEKRRALNREQSAFLSKQQEDTLEEKKSQSNSA